jgi:hypothetical protein
MVAAIKTAIKVEAAKGLVWLLMQKSSSLYLTRNYKHGWQKNFYFKKHPSAST